MASFVCVTYCSLVWSLLPFHSNLWPFMAFYGFLWVFMVFYGLLWPFMDFIAYHVLLCPFNGPLFPNIVLFSRGHRSKLIFSGSFCSTFSNVIIIGSISPYALRLIIEIGNQSSSFFSFLILWGVNIEFV